MERIEAYKFILNIPNYIKSILNSKYWFLFNDIFVCVKNNKKLFNSKKYSKPPYVYNNELKPNQTKWLHITNTSINLSEVDIPIIVVKYLQAKASRFLEELKLISRKQKRELKDVIYYSLMQIEKYVACENIKYRISNQERNRILSKLKDTIIDNQHNKSHFVQRNSISNSTNKSRVRYKLIDHFKRTSFIKGKLNQESENIEYKQRKILEQYNLLAKDCHLSFVFGKLNYLFKKNNIVIDEDCKLLGGKFYNIYSLEKSLKLNNNTLNTTTISCNSSSSNLINNINKINNKLGEIRLAELLQRKNAFYMPSDNKKYRDKMYFKLACNIKNSELINGNALQEIENKYNKLLRIKEIERSKLDKNVFSETSNYSLNKFNFNNLCNLAKSTSNIHLDGSLYIKSNNISLNNNLIKKKNNLNCINNNVMTLENVNNFNSNITADLFNNSKKNKKTSDISNSTNANTNNTVKDVKSSASVNNFKRKLTLEKKKINKKNIVNSCSNNILPLLSPNFKNIDNKYNTPFISENILSSSLNQKNNFSLFGVINNVIKTNEVEDNEENYSYFNNKNLIFKNLKSKNKSLNLNSKHNEDDNKLKAKIYCKKEMLIQEILHNDVKSNNGVDKVAEKIFKLNNNFSNLTNPEKMDKLKEITVSLNIIKKKRINIEKTHRNLLKIIK